MPEEETAELAERPAAVTPTPPEREEVLAAEVMVALEVLGPPLLVALEVQVQDLGSGIQAWLLAVAVQVRAALLVLPAG